MLAGPVRRSTHPRASVASVNTPTGLREFFSAAGIGGESEELVFPNKSEARFRNSFGSVETPSATVPFSEPELRHQLRELKREQFRIKVARSSSVSSGSINNSSSSSTGTASVSPAITNESSTSGVASVALSLEPNTIHNDHYHRRGSFFSFRRIMKMALLVATGTVSLKSYREYRENQRCKEHVPLFRNYCLQKVNQSPMALAGLFSMKTYVFDESGNLITAMSNNNKSKDESNEKKHLVSLHSDRIDFAHDYQTNVVGYPTKDIYQIMFRVKNEQSSPPIYGTVFAQFERVLPKVDSDHESNQGTLKRDDSSIAASSLPAVRTAKTKQESMEESVIKVFDSIKDGSLLLKLHDGETVRKYRGFIYLQPGLEPDFDAVMLTVQSGDLVQLGFVH